MQSAVGPAGEAKEEGELSEAEAEAETEAERQASDEAQISLSYHTGRLIPRGILWHKQLTLPGSIGRHPAPCEFKHASGKHQTKVMGAAVLSEHIPGLTTCAGMQTDTTARIARHTSPL